jgi:hypothetical protein
MERVGVMATKRKIDVVFSAYANYGEEYPVFYLNDTENLGGVRIMLSEEEVQDYKTTMERYHRWQQLIKSKAFPSLEDF